MNSTLDSENKRGVAVLSRPFAIVAAIVLAVAAAFKIEELTRSAGETLVWGIVSERTLLFLLVQVELLAAFMLLAGWLPRFTWRATGLLFCAFAGVVAVKLVRGEESCGCFGRFEINPYVALGLDAFFLLGFLLLPAPSGIRPIKDPMPPRVAFAGLGYFAAAVFASYALAFLAPASLGADGQIVGDGIVDLQPAAWQGKTLPVAGHIECEVNLLRGRWQLVFVRHNCPLCHELMPECEDFARRLRAAGSDLGVVIVEVPPFGAEIALASDSACHYGRLSAGRDWQISTPIKVDLVNGQVTRVAMGR